MLNFHVFYTVAFFRTFCVVPAIGCTNQITGDTADTLKFWFMLTLTASAFRTNVADDAGIATDTVAVNRMVDRAVANTAFLHAANDLLEGFQIVTWVAVQLDVSDMTAVGQLMIWSLQFDFLEGADVIVNRNVEGVGVIFAVGDAFDAAETLAVDFYKANKAVV